MENKNTRKKKTILILIAILITILIVTTIGISFLKKSNSSIEKELDNIVMLNDGELPDITMNAEGNPSFISGAYSDKIVTDFDSAIDSLNDVKNLMGIENPSEEYKEKELTTSDSGFFYKIQQYYEGIPVYGIELIIVTDFYGKTTCLVGDYKKINISTKPNISENEARKIIGCDENAELELCVYALDVEPVLCWHKLGLNEVFISAYSGEMVTTITNIHTFSSVGNDLYDVSRSFEVDKNGNTYIMRDTTRGINVYNDNNLTTKAEIDNLTFSNILKHATIIQSNDNVWNDKESVQAMYAVKNAIDFYKSKVQQAFINNKISEINVLVNYGQNYENAFSATDEKNLSTTYLCIGDGKNYINCYDVLYHEFTHSIITATCNLKYLNQSGAINESYADILGNLLEDSDDWLIGEDLGSGIIRNLQSPSDCLQPEKVNDNNMHAYCYENHDHSKCYKNHNHNDGGCTTCDYGGVHTNSGIINHAAYLMWENGIDKSELLSLFCKSLEYMTSNTNFLGCRSAVLRSARELNFSTDKITIIANAFSKVGIKPNVADSRIANVIGKVVDSETKESISDVRIIVKRVIGDKTSVAGTISYTNTKGEFSLLLPTGVYEITLSVGGYEDSVIGDVKIDDWEKVTLNDILLKKEEILIATGTVKDNDTSKAIKGVTVEAIDNKSDSFDPIATTTTDENGKFTLELPYGNYSLSFKHENYEEYEMYLNNISANNAVLLEDVILNAKIIKLTDDYAKNLWETANDIYCSWVIHRDHNGYTDSSDSLEVGAELFGGDTDWLYYHVNHNEITSVSQLNKHLSNYFDSNICNDITSDFIDVNGKLYSKMIDGLGDDFRVFKDVTVKEQSDNTAIISINFYDIVYGESYNIDQTLRYENGKWIFADYFNYCFGNYKSVDSKDDTSNNINEEPILYDLDFMITKENVRAFLNGCLNHIEDYNARIYSIDVSYDVDHYEFMKAEIKIQTTGLSEDSIYVCFYPKRNSGSTYLYYISVGGIHVDNKMDSEYVSRQIIIEAIEIHLSKVSLYEAQIELIDNNSSSQANDFYFLPNEEYRCDIGITYSPWNTYYTYSIKNTSIEDKYK
ncbi:MAG: M4 family metallopeptidase [Clostridia bacterium]|nr:M4 family metallopeptidase [Clostridia bacterium]